MNDMMLQATLLTRANRLSEATALLLSTGTEVSSNVGFQNSLVRRVWRGAVISQGYDRIAPLLVDGRGVLAPAVAGFSI